MRHPRHAHNSFSQLRIVVLVPLVLAAATGIAHSPAGTPIVRQNPRLRAVRVLTLCACAVAASLVIMAAVLRADDLSMVAPLARNYLWLSALALGTAVAVGPSYAWLPLALAFGITLVTPASESPWSPYGLLFSTDASPDQLVIVSLLFALAAVAFVWNPRRFGYL